MIINNDIFNLRQIAESGQCFRMNQLEENKYSLVAFGRYLELKQLNAEQVELSCGEEDYELVWKGYFDLEYDYRRITERLLSGRDSFLREAVQYGHGIRILRQDFFETLISFIISQNKNIPAIKSCIEAICAKYGTWKACAYGGADTGYYTFPTPGALAGADRDELRGLKVGYRDEYILRAAKAVAEGELDPDYLRTCSYEEAKKKLKELHGIGEKVANCVCLYGLHHIEAFPVDLWIKRILKGIYQDQFDSTQFDGYMGIVQQYMFYYIRSGVPAAVPLSVKLLL